MNGVNSVDNLKSIGPLKSFIIGNKIIFTNFSTFLGICKSPVILTIIATCFLLMIGHCEFCLFIATLLYLFATWQIAIAQIASSYFIKDALENKEIKTAKEYKSYVTQHPKSLFKLLFCVFGYMLLAGICLAAIINVILSTLNVMLSILFITMGTAYNVAISIISEIVTLIAVIIISISISPVMLTWAYNKKEKETLIIKNAINLGFNNVGGIFIFNLFAGTFAIIINFIAIFILSLAFVFITRELKTIVLIPEIIGIITSVFVPIYFSAVFTRYYFSLVNKK